MKGIREADVQFEGYRVRCWESGAGFPILMLHGSGPGASALGNWRLVLEALAERYHVLATDLIGFGLSDRKKEEPYFDLELWARQAQYLLDRLPSGSVGVIGHSLSATLALRLAAANSRILKVMTTGAMGTAFKVNRYLEMAWTFPETREQLRHVAEALVYDKSVITDAYLDGRIQVLHNGNYGAYFSAMFKGDKQRFVDASVLREDELAQIKCDVLMMHGRDDLPIPFEATTSVLSRALPQADVFVVARCGHSPALEHSDKFLAAARMLFG